jgi:hypothetical protein
MRKILGAITVLTLAACGSQSGNEQAGNGQAGAAPAAAGGSAATTLQPGQWETTIEILNISAPNMPAGMTPPRMPARTVSVCITPEQAGNPNAGVLSGNSNQAGCNTENYSVAGGRIQGTITCDIQGARTRTTMTGQFTPTSYEMTSQSEAIVGGMTTNTETRITARRTGDCRR